MDGNGFSVVDPASPGAQRALGRYLAELASRFPEEFDAAAALAEAGDCFRPPQGVFVVAGPVDDPVACGAVLFLDGQRGEIKRMWVSPTTRGQGVATSLLSYLEEVVRQSGRAQVVLDTNRALTEAVALYEKRGYLPTVRYNDNPHAHLWFNKSL